MCSNVHAEDAECEKWAEEGECERNPLWMGKNCQDACKQCHSVCVNKHNHQQCQHWAEIGECKKNPAWMLVHCARSCEVCDPGTGVGEVCGGGGERGLAVVVVGLPLLPSV